MSNYYLTNAAGLGHYDSATDRIVIDENIDGYKPIADAADVSLGGTAGAGDGQNFAFHVSYADPTTSAEWESNILTLEQGTPDELAYVSTVDSNTGSKMFDSFSATPSSLLIVGAVNHESFNRVSNFIPTFDDNIVPYELTNSSLVEQASEEYIITPKDASNGELLLQWGVIYSLIQSTSDDDLNGFLELQYFRGSNSTWYSFGDSINLGVINVTPDGGTALVGNYGQVTFMETLGSSSTRKNADGNWQIRIAGRPSQSTTRLLSQKRKIIYQEI